MTQLLDSVRHRARQQQTDHAQQYVALVRAYLDETADLEPDEVLAILEAAGKSADQLEADAAELRQALADAVLVAGRAETEEALRGSVAALRTICAEFTAIKREFQEREIAVTAEGSRLNVRLAAIELAEGRLRNRKNTMTFSSEQELAAIRKAVATELRALDDDLDHPGVATTTAGRFARAKAELFEATQGRHAERFTDSAREQRIRLAKGYEQAFVRRSAQREAVRQQLHAVNADMAVVEKEKLAP